VNRKRREPLHRLSDRSSHSKTDSFDVLLERAQRFFMRDDIERGLAVLEEIPTRYHHHPDFLMVRGQAYYVQGKFADAIDDLESYLKRRPQDTRMYFTLALAYTEMEWRAHVVQALRRYLAGQPGETKEVAAAKELLVMTEVEVFALHSDYGVPKDQCISASYYNEEVMRALDNGQFETALRAARRAIQLAPRWPSPYNNRATALFESGRTDEAIAQTKQVLETIAPDNLFALSNMMIFFTLLNQRESAAIYAESLRQSGTVSRWGESDLEVIIHAWAYWEDGAQLFEIAKWVQDKGLIEHLSFHAIYALAVAALNTGHFEVARVYFQYAWDTGVQAPIIERMLNLIKDASGAVTIPTTTGSLSYIPGILLLKSVPLGDLLEIIKEAEEQPQWTEPLTRKRDALLRRHPKLALGVINFFKDVDPYSEEFAHAVTLMGSLGTPRAHEMLRAFGFSKVGSSQARLTALSSLSRAKQLKPGERVKIWDEDAGDWREVVLTGFAIKEPDSSPYIKKVQELINESIVANRAGNYDRAVTLLEQALKLDPHCGQAAYNIGAIRMTQGNEAEGKSWIARAIEVEPDYLFAHAALAKLLAREGKTEEALERLDIFVTQEEVTPSAYITYQDALFTVSMVKGDFDEAERILLAIEEIFPDEKIVRLMRERWGAYEDTPIWHRWQERWLEGVHRRHERMLAAPITLDADARVCLDRLTREDALPMVAKRLSVSTQGRKAALIEAIATALVSSETIERMLAVLPDSARAALRMLLDRDGAMPWQEFTTTFGDDVDESPYWTYHEPKSVPGVLKSHGLLAVGTYKGQRLALIPADLRVLLSEGLKNF